MKRWGGEEVMGDLELGGGMALLCFALLFWVLQRFGDREGEADGVRRGK